MNKIKVQKLFSICNDLVVPLSQRDYIFQRAKIDNMLNQIRDSKYYDFDLLMLYEENKKYYIVNGQQRLVSYYLILLALASKCYMLNKIDMYQSIVDNNIVTLNISLRNEEKEVLNDLRKDIIDKGYRYRFKHQDSEIMKAFVYIYDHLDCQKRSFKGEHYYIKVIFDNLSNIKGYCRIISKDDSYSCFIKSNEKSSLKTKYRNYYIKNYILNLLENEKKDIFLKKWKDLESLSRFYSKMYNTGKIKGFFDRFLRQYLTIKLNKIPKNDLFNEFKNYFSSSNLSIQEIYEDIYNYGIDYKRLFLGKMEDNELNEIFDDISKSCFGHRLESKINKNEYSYEEIQVFVLRIYNDYNNNRITKTELIKIIKHIESYIIRRDLCDMNSEELPSEFIKLYNNINFNEYLRSFINNILKLNNNNKFPTDEELREKLIVHDFISDKDINRYILASIEYSINDFKGDLSDFQIEHILPQEINEDWKYDLGHNWEKDHIKFKNTIGNLTLLEKEYNNSLKNKSFYEKTHLENIGYKLSKIKLTRNITSYNQWNANTIKERSNQLTEKIIELWPYPTQ